MAKEFSFDDIINELKKNASLKTVGNYEFTELTLKQQREILSAGFESVETPAKLTNIYNNYIKTCVNYADSMVSILEDTKIERRGYLLNILRTMSIGELYYKEDEDNENAPRKCFTLYKVKPEDLDVEVAPKVITFGPNNEFTIELETPTLAKDNQYNALLVNALQPYTKKRDNSIVGSVADLYQVYEIVKYINKCGMNDKVFDFASKPMPDKQKYLNVLPQAVISQINEYIRYAKSFEANALEAIAEDGEKTTISFDELFFIKASKEDEDKKDNKN